MTGDPRSNGAGAGIRPKFEPPPMAMPGTGANNAPMGAGKGNSVFSQY